MRTHAGTRFQWRWAAVLAVVLAAYGGLHLGERFFLESIRNEWGTLRDEVDEKRRTAANNTIAAYFNEITSRAERLAEQQYLRTALTSYGEQHVLRLQRKLLESEFSPAAVFDKEGSLIAYSGVFPVTEFRLVPAQFGNIQISRGRPTVYTGITFPVLDDGDTIGYVLTANTLSIETPLRERFITATTLEDRLSTVLNTDVTVDYNYSAPERNDGRYFGVPIGNGKHILAMIYALRADLDSYLQQISMLFAKGQAFLLLAFIAILSVMAFRSYLAIADHRMRILAFTFHIWALRFALLFTGITQTLLPEALLDPIYFASAFGFGITNSIGELTVSGLILFANAALLYAWRHGYVREAGPRWHLYLFAALGAAVTPFLVRGFAAVMESLVHDSSFNYDGITSLLSEPALLLMYVNTFLIGAAFLLVFYTFGVLVHKLYSRLEEGSTSFTVVFIGMNAAALGLFLWLTGNLLLSPVWYVLSQVLFIGTGISTLPHPFTNFEWKLPAAVVFWLIVSLAAAPLFHHYMGERRSAEVEAIAQNISQPLDGWSTIQVEQTLISVLVGRNVPARGTDDNSQIAFKAWAESPFSALPNNSALIVLQDSAVISSFALGIPADLILSQLGQEIDTLQPMRIVKRYAGMPIRLSALYLGKTEIAPNYTIIAALESRDPFAQDFENHDILRTEDDLQNLAPEDRFIYSKFVQDKQLISTHSDVAKVKYLPSDVQRRISRGATELWGTLPTEDGQRPTYFVVRYTDIGEEVFAVTIGSPATVFTLYRYLRIAFAFLLTGAIIALIVGLIRNKSLGLTPLPFTTKLQVAFLFIAAIPVTLVWISARQIVNDNAASYHEAQLKESLGNLERNFHRAVPDSLPVRAGAATIDENDCYDIRTATGDHISLYLDRQLAASSLSELYRTSLLPGILAPSAYLDLYLERKDFTVNEETFGESVYYVGYQAIRDTDGEIIAVISTPALFEQRNETLGFIRVTATLYLWISAIVLLVVAASVFLSRQIAKPLRILISATHAIASGNLHQRVETKGSREIEELGQAFNIMTEKLQQSQRDLARAERELAWKEMAKQVAHEIRNPLTPMRLAAQHLRHAYQSGTANIGDLIEKITNTILEQIERLTKISTEFSRFARMPHRNIESIPLAHVLQECVNLFRHSEGISFEESLDEDLPPVQADREEIVTVFTNLLRNAVQAIEGEGSVTVSTEMWDQAVRTVIRDTGNGIDPDILPRIFEPSFSTKTDGMGMGLAIIKKIIDDMGGKIGIDSTLGVGTKVIVDLPFESA